VALTIDLVDYGPLYNAFGAQRNAAVLATTQRQIAAGQLGFKAQQEGFAADVLRFRAGQESSNAQLVSSLVQMAADIGKTIYSTMKDTALEKTKVAAINLETEYSKRISQGIYTGQISFDSEGKLQIPDELEAWYKEEAGKISKGLEGFPEVQAWASGQTAAIQQSGEIHALNVASQAATVQRAAAQKDTLQMALNKAVAAGNMAPVDSALEGFTNMSDQEKKMLRSIAGQDFDFRSREGGIRNLVAVKGYDVGATVVEGWRKSGEVTSEQADSLLNTAANQGKVQGVVYAQQAQAAYQKMIDAGVDAEAAVKIVAKGIPEAYRSQTEELLQAAAETVATRTDNVADEKMQDYYKNHRGDPAGLRAFLDLPANGFSKAMKRETYMYWDAVAEAVLKKTEPEPPMSPGEVDLKNWFYDPMKTDTMVGKHAQELVNAGLLDPTVAPEWLAKMSERKYFTNPIVLSGQNIINSTLDLIAEKEKDPTKRSAIQFAQRDALMNLDKFLGEGPHTEAQVSGAVQAFLKPYKADLLKADWWNPATRREVDVIRAQAWQGRYIPPDQQVAFERYDRDMLASNYGVGKKAGTIIQSSELMDNGMSRFAIVGLNPKHPKDAFYYTFQSDPATGTEQLMVLEEKKNAQGQTIGANWRPADFVKTLTQERAAKVEEVAGAAAAEGVTGPQAVARIAAAVGVKPSELTPAELKQVPTGTLPGEVEATPAQVNKVLAFLKGKTSVTLAEIRKVAKQIGLTEEKLTEVATHRGIKVIQ